MAAGMSSLYKHTMLYVKDTGHGPFAAVYMVSLHVVIVDVFSTPVWATMATVFGYDNGRRTDENMIPNRGQ